MRGRERRLRNLYELNSFRLTTPEVSRHWGWLGDETCGMFVVPSPIDGAPMKVVASSGEGWDHVSVSRKNRCPNWPEMDHVKRMFFKDDEVAIQLHVPPRDHINQHNYCLHLWRPQLKDIPMPPMEFV